VGAVATGMAYLAMVSIMSRARITQQGRPYAAVGVFIKFAISLDIAGGCAIESKASFRGHNGPREFQCSCAFVSRPAMM